MDAVFGEWVEQSQNELVVVVYVTLGNSDSDPDFFMTVTEVNLFVVLLRDTTSVLGPTDCASSEGAAGFPACTIVSFNKDSHSFSFIGALNFV